MSEKTKIENINNKILVSALPGIIFIVYTVITFIIWGDDKEDGFWLGWTFSLIAAGITCAMPFMIVENKKAVKSILDKFSIPFITSIYFVAQLVLGLFCMILNEGPMPLLVVLEVILHAVYLFFIISAIMGTNVVSGIEKNQKEKVFFVKSITVDLELIAGKIKDNDLNMKAKKVAEIAKYSDPMSSSNLAGIESIISTKVEELKEIVEEENMDTNKVSKLLDKIEEKFLERNEKCKILK